MPVSTSEGTRHESDLEYWQDKMFGPQQKEDAGGEGKMYLCRHGDTNCNDDGEVHGWVDQPLNEKGVEQAHKTAESLKDKNITRIICSDLPRAKQTGNILAKELGCEIHFDPNLRTWDSGDFDYTQAHDEFDKYTRPNQRVYKDEDLPNTLKQFKDTFSNRFAGEPGRLPSIVPGDTFKETNSVGSWKRPQAYTLKDNVQRPVWSNPMHDKDAAFQKIPYYSTPYAAEIYGKMEKAPEIQ